MWSWVCFRWSYSELMRTAYHTHRMGSKIYQSSIKLINTHTVATNANTCPHTYLSPECSNLFKAFAVLIVASAHGYLVSRVYGAYLHKLLFEFWWFFFSTLLLSRMWETGFWVLLRKNGVRVCVCARAVNLTQVQGHALMFGHFKNYTTGKDNVLFVWVSLNGLCASAICFLSYSLSFSFSICVVRRWPVHWTHMQTHADTHTHTFTPLILINIHTLCMS